MPATPLKHIFAAAALMSAAMTASALTTSSNTFSEQDLQAMLAQSQPAQPHPQTELASQKRLQIGLSDPGTELVLPWFLADLVDAVNQRTPPHALARKLRDGI
ncbi:hypothetical protein LMG19083_01621 [Ralstonia psammae]|uniref:Uncharacterized protein n=1 Tax=Ralstonia psammae TaxID=3058598 RepID=A0ABM9JA68_9RALS|nr:hypothetical protein [Ralstonia sp. LMG 19083]CAJ0787728.1 hypothetical protein LMG19083_01621 [Ralstonia sp. LMG 19083]